MPYHKNKQQAFQAAQQGMKQLDDVYNNLVQDDASYGKLVEKYLQENNMFFTPENEEPVYTDVVEINLSEIEANLSGPK
ncbi:hypothetical protein, partial [Heyndrickxia sporothermodurans]